jgi:hypothetical protein
MTPTLTALIADLIGERSLLDGEIALETLAFIGHLGSSKA